MTDLYTSGFNNGVRASAAVLQSRADELRAADNHISRTLARIFDEEAESVLKMLLRETGDSAPPDSHTAFTAAAKTMWEQHSSSDLVPWEKLSPLGRQDLIKNAYAIIQAWRRALMQEISDTGQLQGEN